MWNTLIYTPILNILVLLLSYITFGDLGFAIILLTILVKTILYPLSRKAITSQIELALIQKDLAELKAKGLSKEDHAKATFELYRQKKVNPFSGCIVMLIQIPIIFGLYLVLSRGLDFANAPLYSFVHAPETMNTVFLGLIDLLKTHSIPIAVIVALSQFAQAYFSPTQKIQAQHASNTTGFAADMQKSMQTQMKFIFPLFIGFIAYRFQAAVGLYWVANNLITMVQERSIARHIKRKDILKIEAEILNKS